VKIQQTMQAQPLDEVLSLRAEVARVLGMQPPDLALLHAALERVDGLLEKARAELISVVREVQPK